MTAKLIPITDSKPLQATLTDEALVAACGTGDAEALGALYDRYAQDVCKFLSRLTYVDPQDAPDLVQDVFLAVMKNAKRFRGDSAVRTWVFGIAANLARTAARSSRRGRVAKTKLSLIAPPTPRVPEADAIASQAVNRLRRALDTLSHAQREAFVMCHLEGIAGPEAARSLGVPVGTLYRRLHEARQHLLTKMQEGA